MPAAFCDQTVAEGVQPVEQRLERAVVGVDADAVLPVVAQDPPNLAGQLDAERGRLGRRRP